MGGLSTTHYDAATIALSSSADGDTATATSGGTVGGRALSDKALGSDDGLRVAAIEVVSLRSTVNAFTLGVVDNTASLSAWLGSSTEAGFLWRRTPQIERFVSESPVTNHGYSAGDVGTIVYLYVDPASRKMWLSASQREGGRYGDGEYARPDLGNAPTYTVPGSGPLRIALTPARGSGSDTNALRLRSRHAQIPLSAADRLGAKPWDARQVTLNFTVNTDHAAVGSELVCTWWDQSPGVITTEPTAAATITVGTGGACSVAIWTSLDSGGAGILGLAPPGASVTSARGHFMPVTVP